LPRIEIQPVIEEGELARLLGGRRKRRLPGVVKKAVDKWTVSLFNLAEPAIVYSKHSLSGAGGGKVRVEGGQEFNSRRMAAGMKDCSEIICFVATVGPRPDEEINRLTAQGDLSEAYVLDAICSAAIENMAVQFAMKLEEDLKETYRSVTWHYSPGTCDWDVAEQKILFELIDAAAIGVHLTDSCLMIPRKSLSGVFGILPRPAAKPVSERNPCLRCDKEDCFARRV